MTTKYLDDNGLLYLWQKIRNTFVSNITWDSTNRKLVRVKKTGTDGAEESTDLVTFAAVATSGSYSDLSGTPSNATPSAAGFMSASDKTKLDGINTGAEANVQSDWSATDTSSDAYILNKPTLGAAATKGVVTSISSTSTNLPTVTAVMNYVSDAVSTAATGAVAYQGLASTSFAPTDYKAGWYWIVGTAGTYCGETCEAGDMIFCSTSASAYSASNFDVIQTNLDITTITNSEIDTIVAS